MSAWFINRHIYYLRSSSGRAKWIIWLGKTSGTPPTFVLTTKSPQLAASTMAMQKASVKLVFKKIWPLTSKFRTYPMK